MKKHHGLLGVLTVCALVSMPVHAQGGLGLGKAESASQSSEEGDSGSKASDSGDRRFYVSPMFSYTKADKDRNTKDGMGGVMSVGKRMTSGLNLELTGFYEQLKDKAAAGKGTAKLTGIGAAAMLFPSHTFPDAYVIVAVHQGHGKNHPTTPVTTGFEYNTTVFDTGLGYIFPLSPYVGFEMALRAEARYRMDAHTRLEAGVGGKQDFYEPVVNLGVMIPLGKLPVEAVPAAAEVVPVADADGDGVPDDQDKCPDTAAGSSVNGEGCPQVADADADGVPDDKDQCPGTPAGTQVNEQGCPVVADADGDGVPDDKDKCPGTPAGTTVDENGCPPAAPVAEGCRAPKPGEPINLEGCATGEAVVLKGVNFEVNSSRLTANAKAILNQVADSLTAQAGMKVEIGGHTDGQGSDKYNLKLSQRRAQAVMDYLVARGIAADRLSAKGYGKTSPIDTNETPEGRELNRRVEMKVLEGGGAPAPAPAAAPAAEPAAQPQQ